MNHHNGSLFRRGGKGKSIANTKKARPRKNRNRWSRMQELRASAGGLRVGPHGMEKKGVSPHSRKTDDHHLRGGKSQCHMQRKKRKVVYETSSDATPGRRTRRGGELSTLSQRDAAPLEREENIPETIMSRKERVSTPSFTRLPGQGTSPRRWGGRKKGITLRR